MNKKHARDALDLYKKFLIPMDRVADFLKVAEIIPQSKDQIVQSNDQIVQEISMIAREKANGLVIYFSDFSTFPILTTPKLTFILFSHYSLFV